MISQVLITTCLLLGFLVLILLGGRLIRYFGMAAEGGLQLKLLFGLIGYNLPYFLELILPLAFFIALMLVFGRLYADSEMAVLMAGGVSRSYLGWLLLPLLVVLFIFEAYLSLIAKPWGVRASDRLWQEQSLSQVFDLIRPEQFVGSGEYSVYVGEIGAKRAYLSDVIIIKSAPSLPIDMPSHLSATDTANATHSPTPNVNTDVNKNVNHSDMLIFAQRATQATDDDGVLYLDLYDGKRYELNSMSLAYNDIGFAHYRVRFDGGRVRELSDKIQGRPLDKLFADNDMASRAELSYRFSLPFLMVLALFVALPLAKTDPRQGRWGRLMVAIFVFLLITLGLVFLKQIMTKYHLGIWAYPSYLLVMFLGAVIANRDDFLPSTRKTTSNQDGIGGDNET